MNVCYATLLGIAFLATIVFIFRKPSKKELKQTIYVCGIGMIVLGFIGFVVLVIMDNFLPWIFNSLMN